jgi:hypothetical protein
MTFGRDRVNLPAERFGTRTRELRTGEEPEYGLNSDRPTQLFLEPPDASPQLLCPFNVEVCLTSFPNFSSAVAHGRERLLKLALITSIPSV